VTVPGEAVGLVVAGPMVEAGASLRLPPGGYIARHSFVVCEAEDAGTCRRLLLAAEALVELDAERIEPLPAGATLEMPTGLLDVDE
jgi:hypothetical protein